MIKELRLEHPIPLMCSFLEVSLSGYYAWLGRGPSKRAQEQCRLELEIKAAHKKTRQSYGAERLQVELAESGTAVSVYRVRKLRKKLGLVCKQRKKFKATTYSGHSLPVAENLLDQNFTASAPNQVWVTDISVPQKAA